MTRFHRDTDFAVRLESTNSRTMSGSWIDHDKRSPAIINFNVLRWNDAHERIIYRLIQLAAVNDEFSGVLQDMRRRVRDVFPILIPTPTQDVHKQDTSLACVHHVFDGRSDKP